MAWTVRDRIPVEVRISALVQKGLGPTQTPVQWVPGISRGEERPGRDADLSPLLVPRSWKSRDIPLLPLWAVRPVQNLTACTEPQCLYNGALYLFYELQNTHFMYFIHFTLSVHICLERMRSQNWNTVVKYTPYFILVIGSHNG